MVHWMLMKKSELTRCLLQILFEDDSMLDLKRNMMYSVKEQIPKHVRAKFVSIFESRRRANSSSKLQDTSTLWMRKYSFEVSSLCVCLSCVVCVMCLVTLACFNFSKKAVWIFFSRTPPTWFIVSTCMTWNGRCRLNGRSSINLPQDTLTLF